MKKIYYAITTVDNKDNKFFAGQNNDGSLILKDKEYYLYDIKVAKKKMMNMGISNLKIIESPVQDSTIWDEPNPWATKPKK